ncbi:MAG: hypothetical protein M4579_002295 [Chaenotheca gracillima]|nr:MAG: hypothetical protein M4579_002295 [Chaenotheca gracillima]
MACADCFKGVLNEGTPKGTIKKVYGVDTYVASPPNGARPTGVIVIIPDAFGWDLNNNRILADNYAEMGGFLVHLPDFMNGKSADPIVFGYMDHITTPGIAATVTKPYYAVLALSHFIPFRRQNGPDVAWPRILSFMRALRADPEVSDLSIGAAGFCWGGPFTFWLCGDKEKAEDGRSLIDAGFTAHPSNLKLPADAEGLTKPMSVAQGSNDIVVNSKAISQIETTLKKSPMHEVVIYEGAKHGFAVRAPPKDEKSSKQGFEATQQAVNFFTKHFKKPAKL